MVREDIYKGDKMKGSKDLQELIRLFIPPIAVTIANKIMNRKEPHRTAEFVP